MSNSKPILPSSEDTEPATSKAIAKAMAVKVDMVHTVASSRQLQALRQSKLHQGPLALQEPEAQHRITAHNMRNIMVARIHTLRMEGIRTTSPTVSITSNKPHSSKRLQALLHPGLQAMSHHLLRLQAGLLLPQMVATTP